MNRKIIITVVAGVVIAALIALAWWWFLNRAQITPPTTGTFGSAQNKSGGTSQTPPTNIGSPVTTNNTNAPLTTGTYQVTNTGGQLVGTYTVSQDGSGNYTFTPINGAANLTPGTYTVGSLGTYTVNQNGSAYPTTIATSTDLGLGTTNTPGVDFLGSGSGTVFNPTPVNQIAGSNPSGGLLPNLGGSLGGSSSNGGLGIAGAVVGAAVIGGITCGVQFGLTTDASVTGAAAGTAAVVAEGAGGAGGADAVGTVLSVPTESIPDQVAFTTAIAGLGAVVGAHTGKAVGGDAPTTFWSCLARTVARVAIQQITVSVVNWINSGFSGSPSFVTNPTQFFTNVADNAAGQYIKGSALAFLCSPFQLQIKIAIANSYANKNSQQCTLTGIIGNVTNFMNGNFSSGGWPGFLSFTTIPTNNPYGAYAYASIGLNTAVNSAVSQQQTQLNQGRGFLTLQQQQNCKVQSTPPSGSNPNQVSTSIGGSANGNGAIVFGAGTGTPNTQSVTTLSNGSGQQGPTQSGATVDTTGYQVCDLVNTTPGSVIAGSIDKTLGLGTDQLNLAQSFDQIISALMTQLLTKALQGGLSNLSGANGLASDYYTPDQLAAQAAGQSLIVQMESDTNNAQSYGGVEQGSISDIQNAQQQLNSLYNCWNNAAAAAASSTITVSSGGTTVDTVAQFKANAAAASSTIAQLNAQVDGFNAEITRANTAITNLEQYQSAALSAASSDDITNITNQYQNAQSTGQLIEASDVTTAQQNRTTLQAQLATLNQQTATSLQQCNASL